MRADLRYMGRGSSYYPRAFAGSAVLGLQGLPAVVGVAATLVLLLASVND